MKTYAPQPKTSGKFSSSIHSRTVSSDSKAFSQQGMTSSHGQEEGNMPEKAWGSIVNNVMKPPRQESVRPKLTVGSPGDRYEQEADRAAATVMKQLHKSAKSKPPSSVYPIKAGSSSSIPVTPLIQRDSDQNATSSAQQAIGSNTLNVETSIQKARGKGEKFSPQVRKPMERAYGRNFSGVRVHNNSQAHQLNQKLHSHAFTTGQDIFFRQGAYRPNHVSGQRLIAHELAHVLQQRNHTIQRSLESQNIYIQRAVGLEFECSNLEITDEPLGAKKGDIIEDNVSEKWQATYEETSEGSPVVEFVVYPAAETKDELTKSATKMKGIAQKYDKSTPTKVNGYEITKAGNIEGAVQATIAVPMENMPAVYKEFIEESGSPTQTAYKRFQKLLEHKTQDRKVWKKALGFIPYYETVTDDISEKAPDGTPVRNLPASTQGFILLVMDYIKRGYVPENIRGEKIKIPFAKGLFPLMARTDFPSMFKTLPVREQNRISEVNSVSRKREIKEIWWKWLTKKAFGNDDLTSSFLMNDQFFNQRLENLTYPRGIKYGGAPIRSDFLKNIPNEDLLVKEGYLGLGKLGNKADVSANDSSKFAPIFELRKPYGSAIAYAKWIDVAEEIWAKYDKIVGGERFNVGGRIT
ncbi:MAG: DUF4157 domain-containing protein [Leptolyngbya sp. SIO1D8]|nr:DUF4157 domain-containing protein [Leptolyngbya sp. SIO1D8]